MAGSRVLSGATGVVGEVLSGKDKFKITGRTAAAVADEVLPALSSTVALLNAQDPSEARNFRTMVTVALREAAATTDGPSPAQTVMIDKIRAALGEED
ncbi:MAG: hypothetical protein JO100_01265 [Pseudonocardia sp.]|nr:hypothetical protein [Pseudonocardia sp.]